MSPHDEIATALTYLYKLFIKIGYILEHEINWSPHTQKPLNIPRLHELQFDQSAINLLQKIPWTTSVALLEDGATNNLIIDYSSEDD